MLTSLRRIVPIFLIGCTCLGAAQGAEIDPIRQALAEKILASSGVDRDVASNGMVRTREAFVRMLQRSVPSTVSQSAISAAVDNELKYDREVSHQANVKFYATRFTEAQLNDVLAFHSSPT